ncbi:FkbM family methyltransferase [Pseudoflavitalea sp. G-6-1-2]|uniref:FkbM family methyltransferase n=1 Tax=Pseudoflavitalea sp. G-6-1-2 TaxID=2728841 RepID=UPI00146B75A9|nr:FkbM family methyltransferase [Pseudoflavitalea sp. G-6-1-2]NML21824.1 FkbM family methyltransferase [Pseudoflavitalea sp. G-6-1-2]
MQKSQNKFSSNLLKGILNRLKVKDAGSYKKAGLNWFSIKRLKHLPADREHIYNLKGQAIHFTNGPELLHSLVEIFGDEVYKTSFDTPTPYILDCGANIGLSVLYFSLHYPNAEVDAFEPDPANFARLKSNAPANNKIRLHNEAIWKENTTLSFINDGTQDSKIGESSKRNTIQVKARRLKDLLGRKVDFLKLDIEGAEYEVLKDCREELKNVDQFFLEYHGSFKQVNELTDIFQWMEQSGFVYYIKESANVYPTPFYRSDRIVPYDVQLNIFCFRKK